MVNGNTLAGCTFRGWVYKPLHVPQEQHFSRNEGCNGTFLCDDGKSCMIAWLASKQNNSEEKGICSPCNANASSMYVEIERARQLSKNGLSCSQLAAILACD